MPMQCAEKLSTPYRQQERLTMRFDPEHKEESSKGTNLDTTACLLEGVVGPVGLESCEVSESVLLMMTELSLLGKLLINLAILPRLSRL